ncbi:unnamed protein product, partial [Choristocarpus tenellus]
AIQWAEGIGGGRGTAMSKKASVAIWRPELTLFEVLVAKGDALKTLGTSWGRSTFLYAEEGIWLAERGMLNVYPTTSHNCSTSTLTTNSQIEDLTGTSTSSQGACVGAKPTFEATVSNVNGREKLLGRGEQHNSPTTTLPRQVYTPEVEEIGAAISAVVIGAGMDSNGEIEISSPEVQGKDNVDKEGKESLVGQSSSRDRGGAISQERVPRQEIGEETIPVSLLYGILEEAGIPWECYRVYAELKKRSYIVRRRPQDRVGWQGSNRPGQLTWCGGRGVERGDGERMYMGETSVPVTFNAYAPNKKFRKTDPGMLEALVVVCR